MQPEIAPGKVFDRSGPPTRTATGSVLSSARTETISQCDPVVARSKRSPASAGTVLIGYAACHRSIPVSWFNARTPLALERKTVLRSPMTSPVELLADQPFTRFWKFEGFTAASNGLYAR